MTPDSTLSFNLIKAIQSKSLRETLDVLNKSTQNLSQQDIVDLNSAIRITNELDADVEGEINRLTAELLLVKIKLISMGKAEPRALVHSIRLEVSSIDLESTAMCLELNEYFCPLRNHPRVWERFTKFHGGVTFIGNSGSPFRIQLVWKPRFSLGGNMGLRLRPNKSDIIAINLPMVMWPAYCLVHLIRSRVAINNTVSEPVNLGPFLGTPNGIIEPLLRFANLRDGDTLVDLGCGDGRVLTTAATLFQCTAIGYETDADLVSDGKRRLLKKKLNSRVSIHNTSAEDADIKEADVVFIFLPVQVISKFIPNLLNKLKSGAVIIAHEQDKLEIATQPDETIPIIHRSGVTVAYKWIAGKKNH